MKEYFFLQYKMVNRKIVDFGLPAFIGYSLLFIVFYFFSELLFSKTEYAIYLYCFIALSLVSKLSEITRNDFLKSIFKRKKYLKVRMLENGAVALPFVLFLGYKNWFVFAFLLLLLVMCLGLINLKTKWNFVIPTPFGKNPFEYTIGFRKTFYMFPIAYVLAFMAVSIGNFNLGVFSMVLITILCLSFYLKPENEYFVWNFSLVPQEFLFKKIKKCLMYFSLLVLPALIALGISFFEKIDLLLLFLIVCYTYLIAIIFAKYAAFPNEVGLPQVILLFMSLIFPPVLIGVIPLLYSQSIKKLRAIL